MANLYDMTEAIKGQSTVEIKTAELLLFLGPPGEKEQGRGNVECA